MEGLIIDIGSPIWPEKVPGLERCIAKLVVPAVDHFGFAFIYYSYYINGIVDDRVVLYSSILLQTIYYYALAVYGPA